MELLAILLPPFIDLINRKIKNSDLRFWVSVLVCIGIGGVINYIDTSFQFVSLRAGLDSVSSTIMIVFGWSQISYIGIYEDSAMEKAVKNF